MGDAEAPAAADAPGEPVAGAAVGVAGTGVAVGAGVGVAAPGARVGAGVGGTQLGAGVGSKVRLQAYVGRDALA